MTRNRGSSLETASGRRFGLSVISGLYGVLRSVERDLVVAGRARQPIPAFRWASWTVIFGACGVAMAEIHPAVLDALDQYDDMMVGFNRQAEARYRAWCNTEGRKALSAFLLEEQPNPPAGRLTDEQVARAEAISIADLLETDKYGYAWCPMAKHSRPRMFTRGGVGYCFICNRGMGPIKYLMEVRGMSYKAAVLELAR